MTAVVETRTETTAPHVRRLPATAGFFYGYGSALRITDVTYFKAVRFKHIAMKKVRFEELEDGSVYGEIPECPGVWARAKSRRSCHQELQTVLSDWVDVKLRDGDRDFPIIEGVNLNVL